jgi:hypothetical protein
MHHLGGRVGGHAQLGRARHYRLGGVIRGGQALVQPDFAGRIDPDKIGEGAADVDA